MTADEKDLAQFYYVTWQRARELRERRCSDTPVADELLAVGNAAALGFQRLTGGHSVTDVTNIGALYKSSKAEPWRSLKCPKRSGLVLKSS
jgi:hypothetical protein